MNVTDGDLGQMPLERLPELPPAFGQELGPQTLLLENTLDELNRSFLVVPWAAKSTFVQSSMAVC